MSAHSFGLEVSQGRLRVSGAVDMAAAPTLQDAIIYAGIIGEGADVVVDLSEVTFVDSSGISALMRGHQRLAANGIELRVRNPSPSALRAFRNSGVSDGAGLPTAFVVE